MTTLTNFQLPFCRIDKLIAKFTWKCKELRADETNLKKENKFERLTYSSIKTDCKTIVIKILKNTVIKMVCYWQKK